MSKSSQPFLVLHEDQDGGMKPHWCFIQFNDGIRSIKIAVADFTKPIPDASDMAELEPVPNKLQVLFDPNLYSLPNITSSFSIEIDSSKKGFYFEFSAPNEVHQYAHDGKSNQWFLINTYSVLDDQNDLESWSDFTHPKWVTSDEVFSLDLPNDLKQKYDDWILEQCSYIKGWTKEKNRAFILIARFWLGHDVGTLEAFSLDDILEAIALYETEAREIIIATSGSVGKDQTQQWRQRVYIPLERFFRETWVSSILMKDPVDVTKEQMTLLLNHVHTIDQLIAVFEGLNDRSEVRRALLSSLTNNKLKLMIDKTPALKDRDRTKNLQSVNFKRLYDCLSLIDAPVTIQLFNAFSVEELRWFIFDSESLFLLSDEKKEQYKAYILSKFDNLWMHPNIFTEDELISLLNEDARYEIESLEDYFRVNFHLFSHFGIQVSKSTWMKTMQLKPIQNALMRHITSSGECVAIFNHMVLLNKWDTDHRERQQGFIQAFLPDERLQLMATRIEPFKTLMKLFSKEEISTLFIQDQSAEELAIRIKQSNRKELLLGCLVVLISLEDREKVRALLSLTPGLFLNPISPTLQQEDLIQAVNTLSEQVEKEKKAEISWSTFQLRYSKHTPSTFEHDAPFKSQDSTGLMLLAALSAALVGGVLLSVVFVAPHIGLVISAVVARVLCIIAADAIGLAVGITIGALAEPTINCISRFFHSINSREAGASNDITTAPSL